MKQTSKVHLSQTEWKELGMFKLLEDTREFFQEHGVNIDDLEMEVDEKGLFLKIEDPKLAMLFKLKQK